MSSADPPSPLDRVRDAFQQCWQRAERPVIEEFLTRVSPDERTRLLSDLIAIDARQRQRAGLPIGKSEYLARFPEAAEFLDDVLQEITDQAPSVAHQPGATVTSDSAGEKTQVRADSSASTAEPNATLSFMKPDALKPAVGVQVGAYRLEKLLGTGGMGTVWQATHLRLEKTVALKLLAPHLVSNQDLVARFEREMKAVGRVDHPNLVRAFDAGDEQGVHFLAIEFIDGPELTRLVRERGPLPVERAVELVRQAAVGLAAAHRSGLIHRDIKPGNMMVTEDGQLKITDLGLALLQAEAAAQETGDALTMHGQILGTPDYMAPEQWDNTHTVDGRCDLYALGCTLFFLLVGKPPYAAMGCTTLIAKRNAHLGAPVPDLRTLVPHVPASLAHIFERLMAKEPQDRFPSAAKLAEELERILRELRQRAPIENRTQVLDGSQILNAGADPPSAYDRTVVFEASDVGVTEAQSTNSSRAHGRKGRGRVVMVWTAVALIGLAGFWFNRPVTTPAGPQHQDAAAGATPLDVTPAEDIRPGKPPGLIETERPATASVSAIPAGSPTRETTTSGWYGWPVEAPAPAIAPFDAMQAKKHQDEWAAYLKLPVEYTNSIGIKFRLIPPGEYLKGSSPEQIEETLELAANNPGWQSMIRWSGPQHRVALTMPFYLAETELTQAQYQEVTGTNPSWFSATGTGEGTSRVAGLDTANFPVDSLSRVDAENFCNALSGREQLPPAYGNDGLLATVIERYGYRLPTEAEWEFACRAGTTTKYWSGDRDQDMLRVGWAAPNSGLRPHPVATLPANPFGLYDVLGNAAEWVQDEWKWFGEYTDRTTRNLLCHGSTASNRSTITRGGDARAAVLVCSAFYRQQLNRTRVNSSHGMRIVMPVLAVKRLQSPDPATWVADAAWRPLLKWMPPTGARTGLKFGGPDIRVVVPDLRLDTNQPYTFEYWAIPTSVSQGGVFRLRVGQDGCGVIWTGASRQWLLASFLQPGRDDEKVGWWGNSIGSLPFERQHVAMTFHPGKNEMQLFVNGAPVREQMSPIASRGTKSPTALDAALVLGAHPRDDGQQFQGILQGLRVSRGIRYDGEFLPDAVFDADADTVAVYRFDEGEGTVLHDASGNGSHGTIHGAEWVKQ